jgi:signal transduction histidine kinase
MTTGKILIVEDESIIALDIKRTLSKAGYTIVGIAVSSEEAIALTAEQAPDLVLMDISIEGNIDGIDTAVQIHETYQIPIIYLTAHADEITLRRAKETPTFGCLLKPFDHRDLATMIEIAISKHKAELAIRQTLKEQQDLNELKSQFISFVSHEFRNPLNIVLVSSELLEQYTEISKLEQQRTCIKRIRSSVKQMNALINDVLTLSEAETVKLQCNPHLTDLMQFCSDLLEEAQLKSSNLHQFYFHLEDQRQAFTTTSLAASSVPIVVTYLDSKLLQPVLTNLLSNAIKYSPQGGAIHFRCIQTFEAITFHIQDQGIGIPSTEQAQLFNSFYRASNVEGIPGSGLGLSIVKQYITLHGGQIQVESQIGRGSTFTVSLPLLMSVADQKS